MPGRYSLRISWHLTLVFLIVHFLAAASVLFLPLSWYSPFLLIVIMGSLAYLLLGPAWLRLPNSCVALDLQEGDVTLHCRDGVSVSGKIQPDTLVSPWLVVLNILPYEQGRSRSVIIMADAMGQEDMRRLRVALRWQT